MSTSQPPATIRSWLAHRLPVDVSAAIDRLARTYDAVHVAVMPDVHLSHEVCVGTVLATRRLIYPNAVGGDIGCGMAAVAFDADADLLRSEAHAAKLLMQLPEFVPAMRHRRRSTIASPAHDKPAQEMTASGASDPVPPLVVSQSPSRKHPTATSNSRCETASGTPSPYSHTTPLSHPRLASILRRDGAVQLGTLGRGNHFLEFQADDEDRLWLMIHSGSRAIGQAVRDLHLQIATRSATGLWYLDGDSAQGRKYLNDAEWARGYASANRRAMVDASITLIKTLFSINAVEGSYFDCDHNHVRRERHFGEDLWIHRKGAAPAGPGVLGMIPGSMATESYHVEGRGCPDALHSSSHGAGRVMSRSEARQRTTPRDLGRQLDGVWYDHRISDALREEAPSAYKDVREVMRAQRDLTRVVRRLRPVVCYKAR